MSKELMSIPCGYYSKRKCKRNGLICKIHIGKICKDKVGVVKPKSPPHPPKPLVSKVFKICDAYESGFGHGLKGDNLPNPYTDLELVEAYNIGYSMGENRRR